MRKKLSYLVCSATVTAMALGAAAFAQAQQARPNPGNRPAANNVAPRPVERGAERIGDEPSAPSLSERSFTKPSAEVELAFASPGLVAKVGVEEGQSVKAGQVLAEQDVSVEKANKATFEIEANSAVEEEYAKADAELKKVELARKEELFKKKNATFLEVEEAKLNVKRAEASVKLATQKRETARAQAAVEQAKIDLKRIVSPIDGMIQKLDTHAGEIASNETQKPAIRLVRNDPLWIDVNFPAEQAIKLKAGQKLDVCYATDQNKWKSAEVLFLNPVVRQGSQTRSVRLVMANPHDEAPGLEVYVKLPDAVATTARQPQAGADR